MARGFENTWASMGPRDREAYGKISAAANPKARRELDRDLRKMGQLHGAERRAAQGLNSEGELNDSQPMIPKMPMREADNEGPVGIALPPGMATEAPSMASAFRQPWAPGQNQGIKAPGFAINQETADAFKRFGLPYTGRIDNSIKPSFGGATEFNPVNWNPWPILPKGSGVRDRMYMTGRDGPAPSGMQPQDSNRIPALPARSQTRSPGIGLDGKRINYSRR